MKIIMTRGLPGSGKTTWAKEYQSKYPNTVRVNKDDLRAMLHNSVHSKGREKFVLEVRNKIVIESLLTNNVVIVDDTNFNPVHEETMRKIAQTLSRDPLSQVDIEIKDFSNVPLEDCIARDSKRPNPVGEKAIRTMYNQYLKPKPEVPIYDATLPCAIVCDLDGTLCLFGGANPYERDFLMDKCNGCVSETLLLLLKRFDAKLILCSGRQDKFGDSTQKWLEIHNIKYDRLFMRKTGDVRKDVIIKKEIYDNEIKGKYNVYLVFDDRNQVVDMWRQEGLTCFQVAPGDF